jgi:pimeloyl-ACP methyl ester carboxylesterase
MWQRLVPCCSADFRVIAVDLPGFGLSANPPAPFTTAQYARFLGCLLDELGIGKTTICGVSYGGQLAFTFAAMFPGRVDRLILISSTGLQRHYPVCSTAFFRFVLRLCSKHIFLRSERFSCLFARRSFGDISRRPADLCADFHREIMQEGKRDAWLDCFQNILSETESASLLPGLTLPTLIIWGERDRTLRLRHGNEFQRRIPGASLVVFPGCAHSLPLECPAELASTIRNFVQSPSHRKDSL